MREKGPGLRLRAPAKINWTLEVLGKRRDGYHEIQSLIQTIDMCDHLALEPAVELSLSVEGAAGALQTSVEENLAYRAAELLRGRFAPDRGVAIKLTKAIPAPAGIGGGSSDAAAVLRGLRILWELSVSDQELASIASELGSDVPFFIHGGTALASGRGEILQQLPDVSTQSLLFANPRRGTRPDKTARMYAAVRPEHYTDGARTKELAARIRAGEYIHDEDLFNVFESVLPDVDPESAELFERAAGLGLGQPHLCGSGPAFYFLRPADHDLEPLLEGLLRLKVPGVEVGTFSSDEAMELEELP